MKVLVTGASGFMGGNLTKFLSNKGWEVTPLIRKGASGDIRSYESIKHLFKGKDIVINCAAALPHHKLPDKSYWDTNVLGVKNVVDACLEGGVKRLVQISTVGVYGPTSAEGANERSRFRPNDVYSRTKFEGEKIILSNIPKLSSVIIRPTIAYGPGDKRPVILRLFQMVKLGLGVTVGNGSNYLHTVYIDNLMNAVVLAAKKDISPGEDFIIGDAQCPTMSEIVQTIAKVQKKGYIKIPVPKNLAIFAGKIIGMEKTVRFNSDNRRYSIDKARRILGYNPEVGLDEGMMRTYEWYMRSNLL